MRVLLFAALLVGGFIFVTSSGSAVMQRLLLGPDRGSVQGVAWSGPDRALSAGLSSDELNNIDIYKRARLATVHITSTVYRRGWFMEVIPSRDMGSGFILDESGNILTNSHVVQGGGKIQVTLENQEVYDARVLFRDRANDLALIRIQPRKKLNTLPLGDSEPLQVGQKVLAIGNPFGLDGTLTTGIVSSIGRNIRDEKGIELEGMIQTDAAINPGNSGGPLLDSHGSVVGINTAIYGSGNMGIGFAMPINRAKSMIDDYKAGKSFKRARIGLGVAYVAGDIAEALRLPAEGGLLIQGIERGSAAAQAGLHGPRQIVLIGNMEIGVGGDLIMEIDGKRVDREDAITRAMSRKRPGDELELTIFREGRTQKVSVVLGEDPGDAI
ncbi:MAG TPA: trypsin-like peptidase domain-containing protein [Bryobacteraceae bacterium]|nr:trypsin-like peptidase domain-containing protein [Bryobacteraceae bacterium]